MADIDPELSEAALFTYLPGESEGMAFVHHGTPLPTQHLHFLELWSATQSTALLRKAYPRLRRVYEFLVGRGEGSTTARLASGLLTTWDYFYNSGGWDDYPAQAAAAARGLTASVAPMVTTAHVLLAGNILTMAASALGLDGDVARYRADRKRLTGAMQLGWDEEAGYFGYVTHDSAGKAAGLLRDGRGTNLNMGLDGVQPLIAGAATERQAAALISRLFDPARLWTDVGITTVDRSASYYDRDGYWNGHVWAAHQWFLWKALLDRGEAELAWQIARTALDGWEREALTSWNVHEHLSVQTGRGAGWPQFGSLSLPLAKWHDAYFSVGRVSTGFGAWVHQSVMSTDAAHVELDIEFFGQRETGGMSTVLCVVAPETPSIATWRGRRIEARLGSGGALTLRVPTRSGRGRLSIGAVQL